MNSLKTEEKTLAGKHRKSTKTYWNYAKSWW